jgi:ABC-2 type transport system ATP-binding protein
VRIPTEPAPTTTAGGRAAAEPLAVETHGLVRRFGDVAAVDGLDLRIPRGGVYGILGPNGSGKTTTIRILATLLSPDSGEARVLGHDVRREGDAVRRAIALTGQYASVDQDLSARQNLELLGWLLGLGRSRAARAAQLLAAFGLADAADRQVKTFSGGMRRRLDIAASIVVTPQLLVLDEPTTGLDPRSRNEVWGIVRALVAAGTTVVLTTQYLEEADALADRIAVMDRGRVIAEGTPGDLKAAVGSGRLRVRVAEPEQREAVAAVLGRTLGTEIVRDRDPAVLSARTDDAEAVATALGELARARQPIASFSLGQPSLDEVFLTLTGDPVPTGDHGRRRGVPAA